MSTNVKHLNFLCSSLINMSNAAGVKRNLVDIIIKYIAHLFRSTPLISISPLCIHPLCIKPSKKMANRAAWIVSGKAKPLKVGDASTQQPEPGTIVIKNHAAAVVSILSTAHKMTRSRLIWIRIHSNRRSTELMFVSYLTGIEVEPRRNYEYSASSITTPSSWEQT